jgi:hypothetical protein
MPDFLAYGGGELVGLPDHAGAIIDNRTDLPNGAVQQAIEDWWVETAAFQMSQPTSFQTYSTNGEASMVNRQPFRTPSNVFEEIRLARTFADTDDDVGSVIDGIIALAFGEGMENFHEDVTTLALFNEAAKYMNLDNRLKELYREYLIAGQFTSASFFTRTRLSYTPDGTEQERTEQVAVPLIGVLPAENIRVIDTDLVGTGTLAYKVDNPDLEQWLEEFFGKRTTAARKNAMRAERPLIAALFVERVQMPTSYSMNVLGDGEVVWKLNPRMCKRTSMPKGASAYPRPLLTRNFALLEAKRLLNIMDYALLQGGTNYIVIAKKGSDQLPAQPAEITNLRRQVQSLGRSGVMVGDHRLSLEVVTPDLESLLNPGKRRLVGRKIAAALLRRPDMNTDEEGGAEAAKTEAEWISRIVSSDRRDVKRHVEGDQYTEMTKRNRAKFKRGAPKLWFPKIILAGQREWLDYVLKLADRGNIPRKWVTEAGGFDWEAGLSQRKRELERGDDEIMVPGEVPFNEPGQTPGDVPEGRPRGTSPDNGRPNSPSRSDGDPVPQPRRRRPRGEPVRAWFDEGQNRVLRLGELTGAILEEYPRAQMGRITEIERTAAASSECFQRGPVIAVPVNPGYEVDDLRAVSLDPGMRLVVGSRRSDGAMVAKALAFRDSDYTEAQAEERALKWGFDVPGWVNEDTSTALDIRVPQPDPQPTFVDVLASATSHPAFGPTLMAIASAVVSGRGGQPLTIHMPGPEGTAVKKVMKTLDDGTVEVTEVPITEGE